MGCAGSVATVEEPRTLSQDAARSMGLRARREMGQWARAAASDAITATLLGLLEIRAAHAVGGYWPTAWEVNLIELWRHLAATGVHVCLPRVGGPNTFEMQFVSWNPTEDMPTNRYGIPEPTGPPTALDRLEVVILPCSAVDDAGTRVGMGAGFYDRAMAPLRGMPVVGTGSTAPGSGTGRTGAAPSQRHRAVLIGVAFECQRVAADTRIVANDWDVGVDLVVTESATVDPVGHTTRR